MDKLDWVNSLIENREGALDRKVDELWMRFSDTLVNVDQRTGAGQESLGLDGKHVISSFGDYQHGS